jgi:4-amino-4-deoxy-L-arabinose transferase-like glycosyltransferase
MSEKNYRERFLWALAIVLILAVYIANLFIPITSDAGKYAAVAKIIVQSGDWINLTIHHESYGHKPQFLFWMAAVFYKLFGVHSSMFKLPVLLYSLFGFYSTYRLGKLLYSEKVGRLAGLMMFSSEIFLLFTNDVHMDILMASSCAFALWMLVSYFQTRKFSHFVLGLAGVGLTVFSKGIVGLSVPVFAVVTHLLLTRQYKELFHPRWLLAIPVIGLFLLPTVVGIYRQLGWEGLYFYFIENNVGRMNGTLKGNNNDLLFYFHTTLYILLPWSFAVLISLFTDIADNIKKGFKNVEGREFITLGGIIWYWLIISVSIAKAPHYMMIMVPLLFIITAKWVVKIFDNKERPKLKKWLYGLQWVTWVLLIILSLLFSLWIFPAKNIGYWLFFAVAIIAFVMSLKVKKQLTRWTMASVIAIALVSWTIDVIVFPGEFNYHSTIPACKVFNKEAGENEVVHTYRSSHRELFFYAKNPGLFLYNEEDLKSALKGKDIWIYTDSQGLEEIKGLGRSFDKIYHFKHKTMGRQSLKFLNPATREKALKDMYLVKIHQ